MITKSDITPRATLIADRRFEIGSVIIHQGARLIVCETLGSVDSLGFFADIGEHVTVYLFFGSAQLKHLKKDR